jgi:hypothetical protein
MGHHCLPKLFSRQRKARGEGLEVFEIAEQTSLSADIAKYANGR